MKMNKMQWKRLTLAMFSGGLLFQVPACAETALFVTSLSSALTAAGVLYLVNRVLD